MLRCRPAIAVVGTVEQKMLHFTENKGSGRKWLKSVPLPVPRLIIRIMAKAAAFSIGRIDDVTPVPTDSMKQKGGRKGRGLIRWQ